MSDWYGAKNHAIGIVGGGRAGHGLLKFFQQSKIANVAFVVDPNQEAPAMEAARALDVRTFTDLQDALQRSPADLVFEVTGKEDVSAELSQLTSGTNIYVVNHQAARVVVQVQDENIERLRTSLTGPLNKIKREINSSLDGSRNIVSRINQIMSSMQMLALNASIEAAKVGVHGKGFMVVADHMTKSVESVRNLTKEIESMNGNIMQVSEQIDSALEHLK
jgi:D-arabinose 1-dehydrogenase-like Zn-dependent alcohol dehydrogenase